MKLTLPPEIEKCRVTEGSMASNYRYGKNGVFVIPFQGQELCCIVSDGMGWDHVSVEWLHHHKCPNWEMMVCIKDTFWEPEECVVQYHPALSEYVNVHPYVLHLWRSQTEPFPTPPLIMV